MAPAPTATALPAPLLFTRNRGSGSDCALTWGNEYVIALTPTWPDRSSGGANSSRPYTAPSFRAGALLPQLLLHGWTGTTATMC